MNGVIGGGQIGLYGHGGGSLEDGDQAGGVGGLQGWGMGEGGWCGKGGEKG